MNFNSGSLKGLGGLLAGDDAGSSEYRCEENESRKSTESKQGELADAVYQSENNAKHREFGVFNLVVPEAEKAELTVVFRYRSSEVDYAGVIFVVGVSGYQSPVQFNNHRERELLVGRFVQSSGCLDNLYSN